MSRLWLNRNGFVDLCDNNNVRLSDCPGFDCRPITYVDKHATGTGDGSSLENAYIDIQTAIDEKPYTEIQIQGYGEFDAYPAGIVLDECVYLKGIDDVWIDDENQGNNAISGTDIFSTKIENISAKRCTFTFMRCANINNCFSKLDNGSATAQGSFEGCIGVFNCSVDSSFQTGSIGAFRRCTDLSDCISYGGDVAGGGFVQCENLTNCSASRTPQPFIICSGIILECSADLGQLDGFRTENATLINCISSNNQGCGYRGLSDTNTYIDCQDINNCLSGSTTCTSGDPAYLCDEV